MSGKYQKVAYYPGCALEGTGHAYNRSTKELGKALGLEITELKNWNCCGAMEVKNVDPKLQTYLSARNLSIAEKMGFDTVMAPCNGCYHNLKKAEYDLANDPGSREVTDRLSRKAGHETYEAGKVETIHALDWIKQAIGEEGLKARVKNSLNGLKVANYYGCMYTRPRHIFPEKDKGPGSESTSKPHFMDDLLAAAGAENVEYPLKTACCGGAHTLSDSDTSTKLVLNLLTTAEACGADVIATECPTCHTGLEMHQVRAEKVFGRKTSVKILYFTQLLGMALGLSARRVGVHENFSEILSVPAGKRVGLMIDAPAKPLDDIAARLEAIIASSDSALVASAPSLADELLALGEMILEHWLSARGVTPTTGAVEGFRLLALHRQGARGDASFNACRETCRELVYHRNLVGLDPAHMDAARRLRLGAMVAKHLLLFIGGKLEVAEVGEFCCSARPLRQHETNTQSAEIA